MKERENKDERVASRYGISGNKAIVFLRHELNSPRSETHPARVN
jgi:hypothetical protein